MIGHLQYEYGVPAKFGEMQTGISSRIDVGFGGVSPYSFNFEGGRTQHIDKLIEEIKNSGNTEKAPSR